MKKIEPIIAPSILNADYGHLADEINMLNESDADWIHLDVMDGMFVPNISFGMPIVSTVNKLTHKFKDVHLMIDKPERYIEAFKKAGADGITIHYEATDDLKQTLKQIKEVGCRTGVAIKPDTPVNVLGPFINDIDMVLIMCIYPGFGGQEFMEITYERVAEMRSIINDAGAKTLIEVDGGVTSENIGKLVETGADVFVVGSFIFRSDNPKNTIKEIKEIASQHAV